MRPLMIGVAVTAMGSAYTEREDIAERGAL